MHRAQASDLGFWVKGEKRTNIYSDAQTLEPDSIQDYDMQQDEQRSVVITKSLANATRMQDEWSIEYQTPNKYLKEFAESNLVLKKKGLIDQNHVSTPSYSNSLVLDVHINKKRRGGVKKGQTKDMMSLKDWKARKNTSVILSSIVLEKEKRNRQSKDAITEELSKKPMGKETWLNQELPILQVEGKRTRPPFLFNRMSHLLQRLGFDYVRMCFIKFTDAYNGLGIHLNNHEHYVVKSVEANSPAQKADVRAHDKILAINSVNASEKNSTELKRMLAAAWRAKKTIELLVINIAKFNVLKRRRHSLYESKLDEKLPNSNWHLLPTFPTISQIGVGHFGQDTLGTRR